MTRISLFAATLALVVAFTLSACGGGGGGSGTGPKPSSQGAPGTTTDTGGGGNPGVAPVNADDGGSNTPPEGEGNTGGTPTASDGLSPAAVRAAAIRSAIGAAASGRRLAVRNGAPTGVTATREVLGAAEIAFTPKAITPWKSAGKAPGVSTVPWFDGSAWTRTRAVSLLDEDPPRNAWVPEKAWVWTDIEQPDVKPFTEVWPLDRDTNSDGTSDALDITTARVKLVTHIARAPEDMREDGDPTSVNPVDRGVRGEDKTFNLGHEISARFDGAYGIYICAAATCQLNVSDGSAKQSPSITSMTGWVFTPKSYTGAGGGTRTPQVLVPDSDWRYFGIWLRGPDPSAEDGYGIATFSGGSEPFAGTAVELSGEAFYAGPAAGYYVKDADGGARTGLFTAKAQFRAVFGGSPGVTGSLSDFRGSGRDLGWSLSLNWAPVSGSGFSGATRGTTRAGTIGGTAGYEDKGNDNHGRWRGRFYGNRDDGYPGGLSGRFDGKFDDGFVVGALGARKTSR